MTQRKLQFLKDELILFSPAFAAVLATIAIGIFLPRNVFLLAMVLLVAASFAALLSYLLPPVRAARARLVEGHYIPDRDR